MATAPVGEHAAPPHATAPFMLPRAQLILTDLIDNRGVPAPLLIPPGATPATGTAGTLISSVITSMIPTITACIPAAATPAGMLAALKEVADPGDNGIALRSGIAKAVRTGIIANAGNLRDRIRLMAALFQPFCDSIAAHCATLTIADTTAMLAEYNAQVLAGTV